MGKSNQSQQAENIGKQATAFTNQAQNNYNNAINTDSTNYNDIMQGYNNSTAGIQAVQNQITAPTPYTPQTVNYSTPGELSTAYGTLGDAQNTFENFAQTGGFTPQGIQAMRTMGMSPITAAYGNTIQNLQQANTLGGGAANYTAALSQAQRELPQQLSTAETGVNADLAQMIQEGELAGAQGLSSVGSTQGGLANTAEAQQLGASVANQQAGLQGASLNNQMNQEYIQNLLQGQALGLSNLQGETSLYGATPGQAALFGNQVLGGLGQETGANKEDTSQPWYDTLLNVGADILDPFSMISNLFSSNNDPTQQPGYNESTV